MLIIFAINPRSLMTGRCFTLSSIVRKEILSLKRSFYIILYFVITYFITWSFFVVTFLLRLFLPVDHYWSAHMLNVSHVSWVRERFYLAIFFLFNVSHWQVALVCREPGFLRFLSGRRKVRRECFKLPI